jgi:hypothetical protein
MNCATMIIPTELLKALSDQELKVAEALTWHCGRSAAIPVDNLALLVGLDRRKVEQLVKHLIEEHAFPIGSATGAKHGYFWITSKDDQQHSERQLEHRIIKTAQRLSALKRNTPAEILDQLALNLKDAESGRAGCTNTPPGLGDHSSPKGALP